MSFNGPSPLNVKNHGCGYQGGPCNCAQCTTFPHLPYKCIPFQQQLYTHRVRTNRHRTPTNYRDLIMNTIPVKGLSQEAAAAETLNAEQIGNTPDLQHTASGTSQAFVDASGAKGETWESGARKDPITPEATMALLTSNQGFGTRAHESINMGTVLNPLDFEYKPPRSQTSTQQSLRAPKSDMRKSTSLCFSQSTTAEDVSQESCTSVFDPYCATHDGRDRSTRKYGPNTTTLKYPRYLNHPESTFKPGYSEWRRESIPPIGREVFVEAPKQRRQISEWERKQRREEAAEEARVMLNNFSSGIGSFKASTLPIGRCKMDLNDVAGQRASFEYFPTVSTACRFQGCRRPGEYTRG